MIWTTTIPFDNIIWWQVQYVNSLQKFVLIGSDDISYECYITTTADCVSFTPLVFVAPNVSNFNYMFATDGNTIHLIQNGLANTVYSANINSLSSWTPTTLTVTILRSIGYGVADPANPVFLISGSDGGNNYFYYSSDAGVTWNSYIVSFTVRRWSFSNPFFFVTSGTQLIKFSLDNAFQIVNQQTLVDTNPTILWGVDSVGSNSICCGANRIIGNSPVGSDGSTFLSIAYINGDLNKFVAVGEIGTEGNIFQTSDGGVTYEKITVGSSALFWVDNNQSLTVAVALNSNLIAYTPPPICLLPDCDVLLSDLTYKNITLLSTDDTVLGYFSNQPKKIRKVIKQTHFINFLQETNKPYLIEKNAFGENMPSKDIRISGHHRIILKANESEHFIGVQAFKLKLCKKETPLTDKVDYYHILLEDKNEGLIVNNLPVESCADDA